MKKFTLLLMVAILACLVMAAAVGCGDRNTPQENNPTDTQTQNEGDNLSFLSYRSAYETTYVGYYPFLGDSSSRIIVIDSIRGLHETDEALGNPFYGEDNDNYDSELSKTMRNYTVEFFENKAILFAILSLPHYEILSLSRIETVDANLVVSFKSPSDDATEQYAEVLTTELFVIEIEKESMENRDVKINIVNKE